ncbi:MAG: OB-fold putative lipoprotein, partial [Dehalococcoidales bacterium]|nr:OB-fold putative lipoprotein [Dehalococcoidales bacterium]
QETEPVPEPELELKPAEVKLTASELFTAYETDDIAAGERFANKILRITGVVSLIDVKNVSDTHYIRLTGSEGGLMQSAQCMFDKKHASLLCQLERGQVVTVQGRYNGSIIAMRMVDCFLIL